MFTAKILLPVILPWSSIIFFTVILLIASVIDLKHRIIPNKIIIAGLIGTIFYKIIYFSLDQCHFSCGYSKLAGWASPPGIMDMLTGLFTGAAPLLVANILNTPACKRNKINGNFGGGDIKLMAMGGFYLGTRSVLASYVYISIATLLVLPPLLVLKKINRKDPVPFGPFLSAGLFFAMLEKVI